MGFLGVHAFFLGHNNERDMAWKLGGLQHVKSHIKLTDIIATSASDVGTFNRTITLIECLEVQVLDRAHKKKTVYGLY